MPAHPTRPVRRAILATLVALSVFASTALMLGAANAGSSQDAPASLAVPAPHQGDRWTYSVVLSGDWDVQRDDTVKLGEAMEFGSFEWLQDPAHLRVDDGLVHAADRLNGSTMTYVPRHLPDDFPESFERTSWDLGDLSAWYKPGSDELLAYGYGFNGTAQATTSILWSPDGSLFESASTASAVGEARFFGVEIQPCFARHALQGRLADLGQPLELFPDCNLGGLFLILPGNTTYKAAGTETVAGQQAVRFEAQPDAQGSDRTVSVWLSPTLPYPVQVAFHHASGEVDGIGGGDAVLTMTGFERGKVPLLAREDVQGPAAPEVKLARSLPWGPDETGVDVPFPLSQAYQSARDSLTWPDLRDYLAAHPEAYLLHAAMSTFEDGSSRDITWRMRFADEASFMTVWITRSIPSAPDGLDVLRPALVRDTPDGHAFDSGAPIPPRPERMPTVASMLERWEAYGSPDDLQRTSRAWGFTVACADAACTEAAVHLTAGNDITAMARATTIPAGVPSNPVMAPTAATISDGSAIGMDLEGEVNSFIMARSGWRTTTTTVAGITPPTGADTGSGNAALAPPASIAAASAAVLADPAGAAGVGLLALLSGLLSYAWPTLKGGVVGLFSRVKEDDLVKHPARAAILQRVEAEPGIHYQALLRAVGGGRGTMEHHVRKLVAGGLLTEARRGGYTCYFPRTAGRHEMAAAGMAKSDGARAILLAVTNQPGLSSLEVAQRCGLQASTVTYHVRRLVEGGLVTAVRDGRQVRLHPSGTAAMMAMHPAVAASGL